MTMFVHVIEAFGDVGNVMRPKEDADRINLALEDIQRKGGKILDVKVTMCRLPPTKANPDLSGTCRLYLIQYEAQKRL